MAEVDTSRTRIDRPFAGRVRTFQLRIGEIGELERLCGAGIGEVMLRLHTHRFRAADVWDTLRLGLVGAGEREALATGIVTRLQDQPIADYLGLAGEILTAAVSGVEPAKAARPGKRTTARRTRPETSPSITGPEAPPAWRRRTSAP